jgi:hypothetical protein
MPHRTLGWRTTAALTCTFALVATGAADAGPLVLRQLATSNGGPQGIAADATGNVYFAEINGSVVRKIDASGAVTVVAGIPGSAGFSGDGGPATSAQLSGPRGIAIDPFGNLLIADYNNRRVRRVTPGGVITTIAGNGASSTSGDGGLAVDAGFVNPTAVFGDAAGNVYIADNYGSVVRKINTQGIISTIAGTGARRPQPSSTSRTASRPLRTAPSTSPTATTRRSGRSIRRASSRRFRGPSSARWAPSPSTRPATSSSRSSSTTS